jgi:CubicO group peptidase (beta-lactamase class C family)
VRIARLALLALCMSAAPASAASKAEAIDAAVRAGMAETGAKGIAVALVEKGRPVVVQAYGARNAAGDPLGPDSVMYGASLTKAVFAFAVMQLADEGKIDLDRPIADTLPKPLPDYGNLDAYGHWADLKDDPRWHAITPAIILSHRTGFGNFFFFEPDERLHIHFDPGSRYGYSGEGMMLLQFALEQGLGLDIGAEVQRRVFDRFGMTHSSLRWRADLAGVDADGWTQEGKAVGHSHQRRVRAAGSMDTSIADMARFAAALTRREGLKPATFARMIRGEAPITTLSQFPTPQPEAPPEKRTPGLMAALGWIRFDGPQGPGFYKGGHDDQTGNIFVCLDRRRACAVILANDVRAEKAFPAIVKAALGETGMPWAWEYGAP